MTEYVNVFREEAKSLFSAYKNHEQDAVERCAKVFGNKTDLTLMNIQHVIAKEYGFNQWNDIVKAEKWDLAGALNVAQNKKLSSPLKIWYGEGHIYSSVERFGISGPATKDTLDLVNFRDKWGANYSSYIHINNFDVSQADLSGLDVSKATFDEWTIWPDDEKRMPKKFNPHEFLEKRKNPGLGIRELHKMGIDGRGRNVAIIETAVLRPHLEYRDNLADYVDLGLENEDVCNLGWQTAVVAGKNCGVAPKAKVYCYRIDAKYKHQKGPLEENENHFVSLIRAIELICDLHQNLLAEGQNGIDVICIEEFFRTVSDDLQNAIDSAKSLGIFVNYRRKFDSKRPVFENENIECFMYGDVDNPADYVLRSGVRAETVLPILKKTLCMVGFGQTVPCQFTIGSYLFNAAACLSHAWQSGLFVLCRSVKPDLTPEEFMKTGLETGDFRDGIGVIVNPRRLIEALRK